MHMAVQRLLGKHKHPSSEADTTSAEMVASPALGSDGVRAGAIPGISGAYKCRGKFESTSTPTPSMRTATRTLVRVRWLCRVSRDQDQKQQRTLQKLVLDLEPYSRGLFLVLPLTG